MQRFNHSTPPHTCSYLWEIRNPPPTAGNPESVTGAPYTTHEIPQPLPAAAVPLVTEEDESAAAVVINVSET
ncbi:hypothetical protein CGMCC3_g2789 [Colletotrichum fructicola]|nr:uncharacterized protein CGMCC3_g2789 [Colletotrichum fructicola]KAE9581481.1 hypothetical protein CGMCC3_g2789 [Colletotrichum fructicola]